MWGLNKRSFSESVFFHIGNLFLGGVAARSVWLSCRMSYSYSCTLLKLYDGLRCHSTGTLMGPSDTFYETGSPERKGNLKINLSQIMRLLSTYKNMICDSPAGSFLLNYFGFYARQQYSERILPVVKTFVCLFLRLLHKSKLCKLWSRNLHCELSKKISLEQWRQRRVPF